jgi:hypothetical protein
MSALSLLEELDRMRRELQNDYPGWQIWYVFHHDGSATWHARPNPWLNAPSPDDLRKLISQANSRTDRDEASGALKEPASALPELTLD